jgi:hypothetical protein
MKALSCAVVFLACMIAQCGISYEEIQTGKDLNGVTVAVGFLAAVALVEWYSEIRRRP